jgi:hypothetical protein
MEKEALLNNITRLRNIYKRHSKKVVRNLYIQLKKEIDYDEIMNSHTEDD